MNQLRKIQYNCRQATFLIEKRLIAKLSFREAIELRIHLAGCSVCTLFSKQSKMINQMVKQLLDDTAPNEIKLDERYKKQLHDRIKDELNKN
ncbi:MAG: hypothetical protein ACXVAY_09825 [Mucilaginibacter sp.]